MKNWLSYDEMVEEALRGVVRQALSEAAKRGLAGDHHFYISFKTQMPGVAIPKYLAAKYPNEMTIVLQHQFWDLHINDTDFSVTLSFGGKPEKLVIPHKAITHFADPSVKFALQFDHEESDIALGDEDVPLALPGTTESKPAPSPGGAEIVTLDQFRQKK